MSIKLTRSMTGVGIVLQIFFLYIMLFSFPSVMIFPDFEGVYLSERIQQIDSYTDINALKEFSKQIVRRSHVSNVVSRILCFITVSMIMFTVIVHIANILAIRTLSHGENVRSKNP